MTRTTVRDEPRPRRWRPLGPGVLAIVTAAFLASVTLAALSEREGSGGFDPDLPNPMGGPAREAPGTASGRLDLGGLVIGGAEVAMGEVPLGVTVVPAWDVRNPTGSELVFEVWEPQVLDGCCPGPVYVDGRLVGLGEPLAVPPGSSVRVQFPLQMHEGMDGPHHLLLPLTAGDDAALVQVTGVFTASARW